MKFTDQYAKFFHYFLPSPFTIAVILSIITFLIAFFFGGENQALNIEYAGELATYWGEGLWNPPLLVFAVQMMLMLVLGHVLALSPPIEKAINKSLKFANNSAQAAFLVAISTILVAYLNWGLGLIFGAIFARKIAEQAMREKRAINYPLIGAAGYLGLMVWHGGISGSSLSKVAEQGHLKSLMQGLISPDQISMLPEQIPFSETVFSPMNNYAIILVLLLMPLLFYWMGKKMGNEEIPNLNFKESKTESPQKRQGADRLDHSKIFAKLFALAIIAAVVWQTIQVPSLASLGFINPNYINLCLLGLGILLHGKFSSFLSGVEEAIGGASGILIQFPLYFGIMGIMKSSGMVNELSNFFVQHSSEFSFPLYTLVSAGIANIFVPSGGGQWAIQGPILVQASLELGISLPKSILAMAYGDQLTNMLQPFWALPLLGITGLKAKEILPYTVLAMFLGILIYLSALILF